ncbi:MAG: sugar ABC transporter permease [Elusimicrobiota bacterium]|jgi:raffinose/stachyose/melibiose transport system permease protein|nr:sugar ABC transporter permease [Elusimicrobiota bacterium]
MQKFLRRYYLFFTAVAFAAFFVSFVFPFVLSIYLSFAQITSPFEANFAGVKNFAGILSDKDFINSLLLTGKFAIVCAISVNVISYFLALFIKYALKNSDIFKSLFFLPNLISAIAVGYFCQAFVAEISTPFFKLLGISSSLPSFWGLVFTLNWQLIGFMSLIYISAMGTVSKEVIEAARLDGASSLKIFLNLKIPAFIPAALISFFLVLINAFKVFEQNLAFDTALKSNKTQLIVLDIYNTFYSKTALEGAAQAKAAVFFAVFAFLFFILFKILKKRGIKL